MINDFDTYQRTTRKTAAYPDDFAVLYPAMGLVAAAGEFLTSFQAVLVEESDLADQKVVDELAEKLGDALCQLAITAEDLGFNLSEIAARNVGKIRGRRP